MVKKAAPRKPQQNAGEKMLGFLMNVKLEVLDKTTLPSHKTKKKITKKAPRRKVISKKAPRKPQQSAGEKMLAFLTSVKTEVLEKKTLPFDVGRFSHLPYNAKSGREYRGKYNRAILMTGGVRNGFTDPRFVTVGDAKRLGAGFAGQKTTELYGWQPHLKEDEETGEKVENGGHFYWFRVFNVQQFANLADLDIPPLKKAQWPDETSAHMVDVVRTHILKNFNKAPEFVENGMVEAPHYEPNKHQIVLPPINQYKSIDLFMLSLVHELIHATGGESELNRFSTLTGGFHTQKQQYAFEEMVAQFATSFLLMEYGFQHETKRSARYILGWFKAIEDKPEILDTALTEAQSVLNHILRNNPVPDFLKESVEDADEDVEELPAAA